MNSLSKVEWSRCANPLLRGMHAVAEKVDRFKEEARQYYFAVLLSAHPCTQCGGRLTMTAASECACECGKTLDPTVEFQRSDCCGAPLERKMLHYACRHCGDIVPSRFLFDEKLFDAEYFRIRMAESRERKRSLRQEIIERMLSSRSGALWFTDTPEIESIPGLGAELDSFVGSMVEIPLTQFVPRDEFRIDEYRRELLCSIPSGCLIRFSAIPSVCADARLDRVRRFVTLVFMEQSREVELTQYGENDIMVERYETVDEGW